VLVPGTLKVTLGYIITGAGGGGTIFSLAGKIQTGQRRKGQYRQSLRYPLKTGTRVG